MAFTPNWQVIGGETPTAAKWTQLGQNDDHLLEQINSILNMVVPIGVAVDYWSNGGAIPSNYKVCDGSAISDPDSPLNGLNIPDLRNKFTRGVANQNLRSSPSNGGADTVALVTANIPPHSHTFSGTTSTGGFHSHGGFVNGVYRAAYHSEGPAYMEARSDLGVVSPGVASAGNHNHTFSGTTSSVGSGTAHNNIPAYVGMVKIMRIK